MTTMTETKDKIKVITIGIEEVPKGFCSPMWLKTKPSRIKVSETFSEGLDITTMEDTFIRMEYPLERFAIDRNRMNFYIRTKDKNAFVELINGWITESNRKAYKKGIKDFAKYLQNRLEPMKFVQNGVGYYRNKFLESLKDTGKEEQND